MFEINQYTAPAQFKAMDTYVPIPFEEIAYAGMQKDARYNQAKQDMASTIGNLESIDIPSNTDDYGYLHGEFIPELENLKNRYSGTQLDDPNVQMQFQNEMGSLMSRHGSRIKAIQQNSQKIKEYKAIKNKQVESGKYDWTLNDPEPWAGLNSSTQSFDAIPKEYNDINPTLESYFKGIEPRIGRKLHTGVYEYGVYDDDIKNIASANANALLMTKEGQSEIERYYKKTGLTPKDVSPSEIAYNLLYSYGQSKKRTKVDGDWSIYRDELKEAKEAKITQGLSDWTRNAKIELARKRAIDGKDNATISVPEEYFEHDFGPKDKDGNYNLDLSTINIEPTFADKDFKNKKNKYDLIQDYERLKSLREKANELVAVGTQPSYNPYVPSVTPIYGKSDRTAIDAVNSDKDLLKEFGVDKVTTKQEADKILDEKMKRIVAASHSDEYNMDLTNQESNIKIKTDYDRAYRVGQSLKGGLGKIKAAFDKEADNLASIKTNGQATMYAVPKLKLTEEQYKLLKKNAKSNDDELESLGFAKKEVPVENEKTGEKSSEIVYEIKTHVPLPDDKLNNYARSNAAYRKLGLSLNTSDNLHLMNEADLNPEETDFITDFYSNVNAIEKLETETINGKETYYITYAASGPNEKPQTFSTTNKTLATDALNALKRKEAQLHKTK
jgi:hypothetical protein